MITPYNRNEAADESVSATELVAVGEQVAVVVDPIGAIRAVGDSEVHPSVARGTLGRPRRAFKSPVSLLRFQRIQPVRHLGQRRLDLAELAIGFHVDFVIELGALVLVGVLVVLADEDEARD